MTDWTKQTDMELLEAFQLACSKAHMANYSDDERVRKREIEGAEEIKSEILAELDRRGKDIDELEGKHDESNR